MAAADWCRQHLKQLMVVASAVSLSRSFHWGIVQGKKFLYAVVDAKMHLNLYGWLHLVRESAEMRDEVGTAMRPSTILNMVVNLWFFRRCSRVDDCRFSSNTDTPLCCLWSPNTNLAVLRFTLSTLSILFWRLGSQTALLYSRVDLTMVKYATSFDCFGQYFRFLRQKFKVLLDFFVILSTWVLQPRSLLMVTPIGTLHDGPLKELCHTVRKVWTLGNCLCRCV